MSLTKSFNKIMMDFKNVNKTSIDVKHGMTLLASLLESWQHIIDILLHKRTMIVSKEARSALFSMEWQRKLRDDNLA